MRSSPAASAVESVTGSLARFGSIDGREIDAVCEFAFGRAQPGLFDWNDHRPADLERLRVGWLPPDHQTSDGVPSDAVKSEGAT